VHFINHQQPNRCCTHQLQRGVLSAGGAIVGRAGESQPIEDRAEKSVLVGSGGHLHLEYRNARDTRSSSGGIDG
jgi:hypothetical protein